MTLTEAINTIQAHHEKVITDGQWFNRWWVYTRDTATLYGAQELITHAERLQGEYAQKIAEAQI